LVKTIMFWLSPMLVRWLYKNRGERNSPFCALSRENAFGALRVCVAMKAPVGLSSGGAVCVSRWRGFAPTSSAECDKRTI
jgi:hypothetical protein